MVILKSLLKNLLLSLVVLGPGFLLMSVHPLLGGMWMLIGSFWLMAKSYRRPWRLSLLTSLLPPVAVAVSYFVQLAIFKDTPSLPFLLGATVVGVVLGLLRGGVHKVYVEKGTIFAQKTVFFLFVWLGCYGLTQLLALLGKSDYGIGRIGGAFSTAMLTVFSIILVAKYFKTKGPLKKLQRSPVTTGIIILIIAGTLLISFAPVHAENGQSGLAGIIEQVITAQDLEPYGGRLTVSSIQSGKNTAKRTFTFYGEQRSKRERITGAIKTWTPMTTIDITLTRHSIPILPGISAYIRNKTHFTKSLTPMGDMLIHRPQTLNFGQYSYLKMTDKGSMSPPHYTYADGVIFQDDWELNIRIVDGAATGEFVLGANWENWEYTKTRDVANQLLSITYGRMSGGLMAAAGLAPDPEKAAIAAVVASIIFVLSGGVINVANDLARTGPGRSRVSTRATRQSASSRIPAYSQFPPLIYDGQPLKTNEHGHYWDPAKGKWINRTEAERIIKELEAEKAATKRERAAALAEHDSRANQDWEILKGTTRTEAEINRRIQEGNLTSPEMPDWVKEKWPDLWKQLQEADRLGEFNRREALTREWLEDNHPESLATLDRILERTAERGFVSQEDLATMRSINKGALDLMVGRNTEMAQYWDGVGQNCDLAEMATFEFLKAGATIFATTATAPITGTALIIGASVGAYQSWWRGDNAGQAIENIVLSGVFNQAGHTMGQVMPDSFIWQAGSTAIAEGTETAIRTRGNIEAIENALAIGFLTGGGGHLMGKAMRSADIDTVPRGSSLDDIADDLTLPSGSRRLSTGARVDGPDIDARIPPRNIDTPDAPGRTPRGGRTTDTPETRSTPRHVDEPDGFRPGDEGGSARTSETGAHVKSETGGLFPEETGGTKLPQTTPRRMEPIVPENGPFGGRTPTDSPDVSRGKAPDLEAPRGRTTDTPETRSASQYPDEPDGIRPGNETGSTRGMESGSKIKGESGGLFPEETSGTRMPETTPRRMEPIVPEDGPFGGRTPTRRPDYSGIDGAPDNMKPMDTTGPVDPLTDNLGKPPAGRVPDFDQPRPPSNPYQGEGMDPNSGARSIDPNSVPTVGEGPQLHRASVLNPGGNGEIFDIHGNHIGNLDAKGRLLDLNDQPIREIIPSARTAHGQTADRVVSYIDNNGNHVMFSEPRIGPNGEVIPGQLAVEKVGVERSALSGDAKMRRTWEPRPDLDVPDRAARPPNASPEWDAVGAGPQGQLTGRDGQLIGNIDTDGVMRTVDGKEILSVGLAREGRVPWYRTEDGIVWTSKGGPTPVDQARMGIGVGEHPDMLKNLQERIIRDEAPTKVPPPG